MNVIFLCKSGFGENNDFKKENCNFYNKYFIKVLVKYNWGFYRNVFFIKLYWYYN